MKTMKYLFGLVLITGLVALGSCGTDDEDPEALTIVSITATGTDVVSGGDIEVDLNGATSANTVPINPVVTITFSREVDAATVSTSTVSIEGVTSTVSASGAVVTVTPTEELPRGTDFSLAIGAVAAADGGTFTATNRSFRTGGRAPVVAPNEADQVAFWKFDDSADDELGTYNPDYVHNIDFVADRHGEAASAANFDGDASIIEINDAASLMVERSSWTISFWMYQDTTENLNADGTAPAGQFVFGMGAFYGVRMENNGRAANFNLANRWEIVPDGEDPFTRNEGFGFGGNGSYNATGGWRGHTYEADLRETGGVASLIAQKWSHIIFTYDAPSKIASIYINGELMKEQDYNLYSIEGSPHPQENAVGWKYAGEEPSVYPDWTFGWVHSRRGEMWDNEPWGNYDLPTANHFKGMLDDFRIFSAHYTPDDVTALYNAERP